MQVKLTMSWRQIIDLKNQEGCKILLSQHPVAVLNKIFEFLKGLFPNSIPSSCPVKPGQYHTNNTIYDSLGSGKSSIDGVVGAFTVGKMPNGLYRVEVRAYNAKDPIGTTIWFIAEFYERNSNETNFWRSQMCELGES